MNLAVGIDLGGTNARVALVGSGGRVERAEKVRLDERAPERVAELLAARALALMAGAGGRALPVGVGLAAQVLGGSGVVSVAPNLGWRDVPFAALLGRRLAAPPLLMNDLGAAAWGEAAVGAARGHRNVILVFVGTGVGSGLILDGRLHTGQLGVAGEFGHVKVRPGGRRCGCGELGCLEAYVSGRSLAERIQERIEGGAPTALRSGASAGDLEQAALAGDGPALELWEEARELLSVAVGNLCTILNPRRLVFGGGVLAGCPALKEAVKKGLFGYALGVSRVDLDVVDAELGDDAGVVGAALHALHPDSPTVTS